MSNRRRRDEDEEINEDDDRDDRSSNKKSPNKNPARSTSPAKRTKSKSPDRRKSEKEDGENNDIHTDKPVRVYVDGVFDMFHFGHARALEQAKKLFPNTYLLVGVSSDSETHALKGRTVMTAEERCESVRHCKWVDEVVPDCPWQITLDWVIENNIDFVAHGEDPCLDANGNDLYAPMKEAGRFKFIKRTDGISTSDLIMRIIKDYDLYVKRNLKRGYSRKDLNVSYMKEKQIQLLNFVERFGKKFDTFRKLITHDGWEEIKNKLSEEFIQTFGPRINQTRLGYSLSSSTNSEEESNSNGEDLSNDSGPINTPPPPRRSAKRRRTKETPEDQNDDEDSTNTFSFNKNNVSTTNLSEKIGSLA